MMMHPKTFKPKKKKDDSLRITKIIAAFGICSRREAETLIADGVITLNGKVVTNPAQTVNLQKDHLKVNNKLITGSPHIKTYVYNKPSDTMGTFDDPKGRPAIKDFLKRVRVKLVPIGPLKYDATGTMLLTNDTELISKLQASKSSVKHTYKIKVKGFPKQTTILKIKKRIQNIDANPNVVFIKRSTQKQSNSWLKLCCTNTKINQIEHIFFQAAHPIHKFSRIRFGNISNAKLAPGGYRELSKDEIKRLYVLANFKE